MLWSFHWILKIYQFYSLKLNHLIKSTDQSLIDYATCLVKLSVNKNWHDNQSNENSNQNMHVDSYFSKEKIKFTSDMIIAVPLNRLLSLFILLVERQQSKSSENCKTTLWLVTCKLAKMILVSVGILLDFKATLFDLHDD